MKYLLKILNPIIFIWNWVLYALHCENEKHCIGDYEHYDFSKDVKYF